MPSKPTVVGLIVLILGSVFLVLFTILLPQFNVAVPVISGSSKTAGTLNINAGNTRRTLVADVAGHPLWVNIRVTFILQGSNERYECNVKLVYESDNYQRSYDIANKSINVNPDINYIQSSMATTLMPPYSSARYDLYLEIENNGNNNIVLGEKVVLVYYSLFSTVIPAIIALVGLILTIFGFIKGKKPSAVKTKAPPGGWEPTLQWGGGAGKASAKKQPKMAIKSSKAPKKGKKVVKKAAPAGGGQIACKFCGKQVASSAFFCPHCYGKLR
ncbi:MAG: hypothetical protein ACXADY_05510 [Candidatus Hodarchaeales archaeon]|jgi:hypothetical protein